MTDVSIPHRRETRKLLTRIFLYSICLLFLKLRSITFQFYFLGYLWLPKCYMYSLTRPRRSTGPRRSTVTGRQSDYMTV